MFGKHKKQSKNKEGGENQKKFVKKFVFKPPSDETIKELLQPLIIEDTNKIIKRVLNNTTETPRVPEVLRKIEMTTEAYNKAICISQIAAERTPPSEIYMHMTSNTRSTREPDKVTDILIAANQRATPGTCTTTPRGNIYSHQEMREKNLFYAGWCHSHAKMRTFHSATDHHNLESLVDTRGIKKRVEVNEEGLRFGFDIWHIPSVVVNAKNNKPDCSIRVKYRLFNQEEYSYWHNEDVTLELVDEENNIMQEREHLVEEMRKKVEFIGSSYISKEKQWQDPLAGLSASEQLDALEEAWRKGESLMKYLPPEKRSRRKYDLQRRTA